MLNKEKKYQKIIIFTLLLTVFLSLCVFKLMRTHEKRVEPYRFNNSHVVKEGYEYHIDQFDKKGNLVKISGWLIKEHNDIMQIDRFLVVKDNKSNKAYKLPTEVQYRSDIKDYLKDNIDYSDSGFLAVIPLSHIRGRDYSLYIVDNSDNKTSIIKLSDTLDWREDGK